MADFVGVDRAEREALILDNLQRQNDSSRGAAVFTLSQIIGTFGIVSNEGAMIVDGIVAKMNPESADKETGLLLIQALLQETGRAMEPVVIQVFPSILSFHGDKSANVRDLASKVGKRFMKITCPNAFRLIFPKLMAANTDEDWRVKVGSLELLKLAAQRMQSQMSPLLSEIIPNVSECVLSAKKQVQVAGIDAMNATCKGVQNDDIRPLVPKLVSVIAHPEESSATLDALLETTFVAQVDSAVLALLAPLLGKCLRGRSSPIKRKASRVIDIMCRLVMDPSDVAPFVPLLLPALDRAIEDLVDAEVQQVATEARTVLLEAMGEGGEVTAGAKGAVSMQVGDAVKGMDYPSVQANLLSALSTIISEVNDGTAPVMREYISQLTAYLVIYESTTNPKKPVDCDEALNWKYALATTAPSQWKDCVAPYMAELLKAKQLSSGDSIESFDPLSPEIDELVQSFRLSALGEVPDYSDDDDDIGASNLCNIEFSLAFGGKILLNQTKLRLGIGRKYGIMGKNGAGKTTLLTNIGTGNIEGLPEHLKTVYVQHDDRTPDLGNPLIEELIAAKDLVEAKVTREEAEAALKNINFTDEMLSQPRSNLSGGWKMKLLIIKAMLSRANVLLLDEPTNHLDQASVQWLIDYLKSQTEITAMIVSHDTAFLDAVITDVIHYETKKLVYYHGNLTHFVEIHPEAKFYYELSGSTLKFTFPTPERLEGINSNTRAIMRMENVSYTYPGVDKPQLTGVNVKVCLGSRVAVLGANGAGKSTMIKMMVQETQPDEGSGEVWKHRNLRLAYVAQHSFHHVEQHLDSSPVDYMKWRFHGGVDKEDLARPNMKLTEEEVLERKQEKKYGDVVEVMGRRKFGHTMEYECTWHGQTAREENKYIPLEKMIEMGHGKLVQQCDAKVAAANAGLDLRPLLTAEIQGHLDDFALEAEYGTHSTIKRLSGGQKVKLVLAAAMWNRPHVLVLDEPTNYLDREALGALTQAIKAFGGGVVIISHNKEFTDAICNENWFVKDGKCITSGGLEEEGKGGKVKTKSMKNIKKSQSEEKSLAKMAKGTDDTVGNVNATVESEVILNPKTLEALTKKEIRKLDKCCAVAGVSLKEYVSKLTWKSPEWKWL